MGKKFDLGKLDWGIIPPESLEPAIRVFMFGEKKYGRNNWLTPNERGEYLTRLRITNAMKRHQAEIDKGNLVDDESGEFHSAHLACGALMQSYMEEKRLWVPVDVKKNEEPFWVNLCDATWPSEDGVYWVRRVNHDPFPISIEGDEGTVLGSELGYRRYHPDDYEDLYIWTEKAWIPPHQL